jgi:chloramphenicol 3-O phosphotransferase
METGKVILLNGASSSGKTSLLKVLQNQLADPYLDMGLDKFIWMLPPRYLDRPLWDEVLGRAIEAGETGHRLVTGMHRAIRAAALAGNNVIADHVLVEPDWVRDCANQLSDIPAFLIGLRCPLDVLEQREAARKDRTLGQARLQFERVHAHGLYDLEVDTSRDDPEESARQIRNWLEAGHPPNALGRLREQCES